MEAWNDSVDVCTSFLHAAILGEDEALAWLVQMSSANISAAIDVNENEQTLIIAKACLMFLYNEGLGGLEPNPEEAGKLGSQVFEVLQEVRERYTYRHTEQYYYIAWLMGYCYCYGLGQKKPSEALMWFRVLSNLEPTGFAYAQYSYGVCFEEGIGITRSSEQAVEWLKKAGNNGLILAQCRLGDYYCKPVNKPFLRINIKEEDTASYWYRKAADQNFSPAQFFMGRFSELGENGVQQNDSAAASWYRKAADRGHQLACYHLGLCYENGIGVHPDHAEAERWYRKSVIDFEKIEANCRDESILSNPKERFKWARIGAAHNIAYAQWLLGTCYEQGQGVPEEVTDAVKWFRKAAERGNIKGCYSLGLCYEQGRGVGVDYERANSLYRCVSTLEASEFKCKDLAKNRSIYWNTNEVSTELLMWIRIAASHGSPMALFYLARCHERGNGISRDEVNAMRLYQRAAEAGSVEAMKELAGCYKAGLKGLPKDSAAADMWLRAAAEHTSSNSGGDGKNCVVC
ncbi:sel1 repeat family protein [archaeon]|nr:MAG: sel1 repeat family protein [archaeon]